MKKILLFIALSVPGLLLAQGINNFNYDTEGKLSCSYVGEDNGNYTVTTYHSNGQKASVGHFKNGVKHGVWKTWNAEGKVEAIAHYKNGEKTGKWKIVNPNEHFFFEINFSHNHMKSAFKKDEHGHILASR